jgi:DNA-binding HxlR family transcriptional regulator
VAFSSRSRVRVRRGLDELAPALQQRGRVRGVVDHLGEDHVADRVGTVIYQLTERGRALMPALDQIAK